MEKLYESKIDQLAVKTSDNRMFANPSVGPNISHYTKSKNIGIKILDASKQVNLGRLLPIKYEVTQDFSLAQQVIPKGSRYWWRD